MSLSGFRGGFCATNIAKEDLIWPTAFPCPFRAVNLRWEWSRGLESLRFLWGEVCGYRCGCGCAPAPAPGENPHAILVLRIHAPAGNSGRGARVYPKCVNLCGFPPRAVGHFELTM